MCACHAAPASRPVARSRRPCRPPRSSCSPSPTRRPTSTSRSRTVPPATCSRTPPSRRSPRSCSSPRTRSRTTSATSWRSCSSTPAWRQSCTPCARSSSTCPDRAGGVVPVWLSSRVDQLTQLQARRIALAAQGFTDRPHATPTMATFDRTLARTGVLQVDSVNVLQRAHFMPLYSRMGPYDVDLLRRAQHGTPRRPRRLVEYWAHVQALMPVELWPLMRHRMEKYRGERGKWGFTADASLEPQVLDAVRDRGPVTARDLEDDFSTGPRTKQHWGWNWSEARKVLDYLYLVGDVAVAGRNSQFEVVY